MLLRSLGLAALALLGAAAGIAAHTAATKGDTLFSWKRPDNLGVKEGRLAPCRRTPNCVCSQSDPSDAVHYVAPIRFEGDAAAAMSVARKATESLPRATVLRHEANYLYAEFRSRLLGFVDDVELAYDEQSGVIHVRSASRLGRRDFGVNRERVEALRALIERRVKA
jgi:uncharacterized protein (DUF1499 family)